MITVAQIVYIIPMQNLKKFQPAASAGSPPAHSGKNVASKGQYKGAIITNTDTIVVCVQCSAMPPV